jgi:hypothetical protein
VADDQSPADGQPQDWTESDRAALDALIRERAHRKWLGDLVKRWAQWIAAAVLGYTLLWEQIVKIVKQVGGPP